MPKQSSSVLKERVLAVLSAHSGGLGIDALLPYFKDITSKRTLQRRLTELIVDQRVISQGEARALRYQLAPSVGEARLVLPALQVRAEGEAYVPLSPSGAEIRNQVRRPISERIPVGYRREFLNDYRPNETAYLTPEIREHLHRLGKTPEAERPAGTYARNMLQRLLVDLAWASSRLEGNTYSLLETEKLVVLGQATEGKETFETQMILNHKSAIEFLVDSAEESSLTPIMLRSLHALLSENLLPSSAACGRLRTDAVGIGGSVYKPLEVGQLIEEYFQQILDTANVIADPFEQSFFLMVQLPYLQPFDDVNKRVSRLAVNAPLFKRNLSPLSFIEVPEKAYVEGILGVYELNRIELLRDVFIWAYERSCQRYIAVRQSLGEPDKFRLRYRSQVMEVVGDIVRNLWPATVEVVSEVAANAGIPDEHFEHFVRVVIVELESLHEGNFARFRLRPSEYDAWAASREKS